MGILNPEDYPTQRFMYAIHGNRAWATFDEWIESWADEWDVAGGTLEASARAVESDSGDVCCVCSAVSKERLSGVAYCGAAECEDYIRDMLPFVDDRYVDASTW